MCEFHFYEYSFYACITVNEILVLHKIIVAFSNCIHTDIQHNLFDISKVTLPVEIHRKKSIAGAFGQSIFAGGPTKNFYFGNEYDGNRIQYEKKKMI